MAIIYEHWRPDLNECFYVGASRVGERRANDFSFRNENYMLVMYELSSKGLSPYVKIVWEDLGDDFVWAYEKIRIAYWRAVLGERLTNIASGGEGYTEWTEKRKAKKSDWWKEYFNSLTEEQREALRLRVRGENNGNSQINEEMVREIRKSNAPQQKIAKMLNISEAIVNQVIRRETWTHVEDEPGVLYLTKEERRELGNQRRAVKSLGSNNPSATITEEIALEIFNAPGSVKEVAKRMGYTYNVVYPIKNKLSWRHIHK